jgi:hypothetical protein
VLIVGERIGRALMEQVDGSADRRQRRAQLVGDDREELLLRLFRLTELARH